MFLASIFAFAQNPLDMFNANIDSNYIQTFPNALTTKVYIKSKLLSLSVEDSKNDYKLTYLPNGNSTIVIGVNYKWIGFGLGFKVIDQNNKEKYGETGYFDFQTRAHFRKGVFELFIQDYKGFYLENSASMIPDWPNNDTYIIRPDIRVFSTGINYTHVFNPEKFSYISSFSQTEVQKKSAGSIILGAATNYHVITADSSFIPPDLIYDDAFSGKSLTRLSGVTTNARFGYAHTFVAVEKFFLSLSLDAGLSYSLSRYSNNIDDKQKGNFNVNPNVSFKFAAGYNHNKWFVGVTATRYYHLNRPLGLDSMIRLEYGHVNIVLARRFMLEKEIWLPEF